MAKKKAQRMRAPTKNKKTKNEAERDREQLKRVALLWWSHLIYEAARKKCDENGYGSGKADMAARIAYGKVIDTLRKTVIALGGSEDNLAVRLEGSYGALNCQSDDECPDDYICVRNCCEWLYPSGN